MSGVGHNRGPSIERGAAWRQHCWGKARAELLPRLPLEVIRLRVRRAKEVGLDYATYATVRAGSGCDIVAFLFSTNALRLVRAGDVLPADRADKLGALRDCGRVVLAQPPLDPERVLAAVVEAQHGMRLEGAAQAPLFTARWGEIRERVRAVLAEARLPASGVLLVGDTALEREWCEAGRLAGYLAAERYFVPGAA